MLHIIAVRNNAMFVCHVVRVDLNNSSVVTTRAILYTIIALRRK